MRLVLVVLAALAVISAALWASDKITLQGERTIYTVRCVGGAWQGLRCNGQMVAAERFRFRALRSHREVIFWTVGAAEPSGKFTECDITDGRNWTCKPNAEATRTITLQMLRGEPAPDPQGRVQAFHAIAKWRWFLLGLGVPVGNDADV